MPLHQRLGRTNTKGCFVSSRSPKGNKEKKKGENGNLLYQNKNQQGKR